MSCSRSRRCADVSVYNLFGDAVPSIDTTGSSSTWDYELGMDFRTAVNGHIVGIRFYMGPGLGVGSHEVQALPARRLP